MTPWKSGFKGLQCEFSRSLIMLYLAFGEGIQQGDQIKKLRRELIIVVLGSSYKQSIHPFSYINISI